MTKGQIESKLSEAISKFEIEQMGRGPEKIRTIIFQDLIIIRLKGFLSTSEKSLAQNKEGIDLIKKLELLCSKMPAKVWKKLLNQSLMSTLLARILM